MNLEHTNTRDQEALQNLQNLVNRVTQESDQAIPSSPPVELENLVQVPRPSMPEALPIQSVPHSGNESEDNDDEGEREGSKVE